MAVANGRLTKRQQLFVHHYMIDMNATQAAIRAGYSEKSAYNQGTRMMKNDEVRRAIEEAWRDKIRRADLTADDVLRLISRAAFADIRDFVDLDEHEMAINHKSDRFDGELVTEVSEETRRMGEEMVTTRKLKLVNKESMIRLLAQHYGLTENKLNVNLTASLPDILAAAAQLEADTGDDDSDE